ncbi:MAG TPA: glycerophosphodiester phosphodiesterase, partial [Pyrinomonadaceae bacterium]|nr:glycerophosphodiester phosphodiesterase [Pyrinomonadaceae bacterium]
KRVVVISFNLSVVALVKERAPAIRTGALFGPRQRATSSARRIVMKTLACGADEILLHHLVAKPGLLSLARQAKLTPVVWTVDNPRWLIRARGNGIHALMTNNPARMLARR